MPTSPSATPSTADAAADGSTLKAMAPTLVSPTNGVRLNTLRPEFVIGTSAAKFTTATFEYRIEVYTEGGALVMNSPKLSAGATWTMPQDLSLNTRYRWRARAEKDSKYGPWAAFTEFLSLDRPPYNGLNPRPLDGRWPSTGPAVAAYVSNAWPQYLAPTALTATRIEHMEFLRDRMIEAGVCGGMDLARNLKRGVGPHSHDALAWRLPNGRVEVVDLASAFDDKTIYLGLHWLIVVGPSGYDPLPNHPGC